MEYLAIVVIYVSCAGICPREVEFITEPMASLEQCIDYTRKQRAVHGSNYIGSKCLPVTLIK